MKRKKWLALLLATVMFLCLCACGSDSSTKKDYDKTQQTTTTTNLKDVIEENTHIDEEFTDDEKDELNINTTLPTIEESIENIALFGLDERGATGEAMATTITNDTIILLTIDRRDSNNPQIKLTSIACDTLVYVEGYNSKDSKTKLCHAFDFGYRQAKAADTVGALTEEDYKREGAKTALATINRNFQLNIVDYIYVNSAEIMDIVDYLGGVTIDVQQQELDELNKHLNAMEKEFDRSFDLISKAGRQTLNGGQALAYSRIRKIDSDLRRTQRCRDVLKAAFDKTKQTPIAKLPDVITKLLSLCHTTLTAEEALTYSSWMAINNPDTLEYVLPDTNVNASWIWEGTHPDYGWVWIYDLDYASALLIDFIYDYDAAKDMPKPTMPDEPRVTGITTTPTNG